LQIFNLSQNAESGSSGAILKQVVNDVAEGYAKALEQANTKIVYLRSQLEGLNSGKSKKSFLSLFSYEGKCNS